MTSTLTWLLQHHGEQTQGWNVWEMIAAIAAVGAGIGAIVVVVQRIRYHPRPHWVLLDVQAKPIPGSENHMIPLKSGGVAASGKILWNVRTVFANHGDGIAYDVQIEGYFDDRWRRFRANRYPSVPPSETVMVRWPYLPMSGLADSSRRDFASGDANVFEFPRNIRISWRQRPGWRKVHTRVFDLNDAQHDVNMIDLIDDSDFPMPPPIATSS